MTKIYEVVIEKPKITSKFGYRIHPIYKTKKFHNGLDLISKVRNRHLFAIDDGYVQKVVTSSPKTGFGNYIWVRYPRYNLSLLYAHCEKILLKKGDKVSRGTIVAIEGKTGLATGVHLHLGMTKIGSNTWLNPENYNMIDSSVTYYVVKRGDTLSSIAKKYKTTWKKIYNLNKSLIDKEAKKHGIKKNFYNYLYAGEKLRVK